MAKNKKPGDRAGEIQTLKTSESWSSKELLSPTSGVLSPSPVSSPTFINSCGNPNELLLLPLSERRGLCFLWFYSPVIRNVWNSIPPSGCIVWLWTSFDHCSVNLTLTAAIYNCSNSLPIIVPSASGGKKERGRGRPQLPRGSLKECDVLLKPERVMKVWRDLCRQQTRAW